MTQSELIHLTEHVYWFTPDETTDRPTLGAIVGTDGVLIVDAGNSTAHADLFLSELGKNGIASPKYLVLTHWHWDHVFGTAVFNVPIFASQETKHIVGEMAQLDLGGVNCRVVHVGGDHAGDASVVYIPEDRVVFLSDCLSPDLYNGPFIYTTKNLFPLLDKILGFEADFYLFGHDTEPASRTEIVEFAAMLRTIGQKVDEVGNDRDRILAELQEALTQLLDEDYVETVDAFLAGL